MSSVLRFTAQRPSRCFVVSQSDGEGGAVSFSESNINDWIAANSSKIVQLGKTLIVPGTTSGSTLPDVLAGLPDSSSTALGYSGDSYQGRKTLLDLGTEYVIGTPVEPRMLVLRRVRAFGPCANGGDDGRAGYVVVENNGSDIVPPGNPDHPTWGRFTVRVARI